MDKTLNTDSTGDGQKSTTTEAESWASKKAQKRKATSVLFSLPAPANSEEELQLRLVTASAGIQSDEARQPGPKSWDLDTQLTNGDGEKFEFSS